ncbi:MAG: hypothetical protein ACYC69_02775 [Thermodesulfovibrionales bacterium]
MYTDIPTIPDELLELYHIDKVTKLDRCYNCRRSLSDVYRIPMIPILTSEGEIAAICPDCLKGQQCISCGSTDTAKMTYFGLVYCKECFNRNPIPPVTIEIDEEDAAELDEILAAYASPILPRINPILPRIKEGDK